MNGPPPPGNPGDISPNADCYKVNNEDIYGLFVRDYDHPETHTSYRVLRVKQADGTIRNKFYRVNDITLQNNSQMCADIPRVGLFQEDNVPMEGGRRRRQLKSRRKQKKGRKTRRFRK
jgi:hypothetical protein